MGRGNGWPRRVEELGRGGGVGRGCPPALPGILASGAVFSASPAPRPGLRGVLGGAGAGAGARCLGRAGWWGQPARGRAGSLCAPPTPPPAFRSLSRHDAQCGRIPAMRAHGGRRAQATLLFKEPGRPRRGQASSRPSPGLGRGANPGTLFLCQPRGGPATWMAVTWINTRFAKPLL